MGMEFFRNKFGVQYMLDAIRQFYRYVIHVIYGLYPFMVLGLCRFCFCYNTIRCISLGCKALIEKSNNQFGELSFHVARFGSEPVNPLTDNSLNASIV